MAGDKGGLLDHEDESSDLIEDARHWVGVYSQLLAFTARLAEEEISPEGWTLLTKRRLHYEQRLAWWQSRLDDIRAQDEGREKRGA